MYTVRRITWVLIIVIDVATGRSHYSSPCSAAVCWYVTLTITFFALIEMNSARPVHWHLILVAVRRHDARRCRMGHLYVPFPTILISSPSPGSDLMGRSTAFNATLFFTATFGLLASLSYSYTSLCVLLFFLGTAVGVRHFLSRSSRFF